MEELNQMNLDELLHAEPSNSMSARLFETADVEVNIIKEELSDDEVMDVPSAEMTKEEFAEVMRNQAMSKLEEYETLERGISTLEAQLALKNQALETLIDTIRESNKELIDSINSLAMEIESKKEEQESIKEELLPLQRHIYDANNADKTLIFNKIQSTYVLPAEQNKFDLKKFREEQKEFWEEHLDVMKSYAKITSVSDYIKVTVKK